MVKNSRRPLIVIVGILLVAAGFGANLFLPQLLGQAATGATSPVIVAKSDLAAGTQLSGDNTKIVYVPQSLVPSGSFADSAQINGRFTRLAVPANTIFIASLVTADQSQVGTANLGNSGLTICKGDVAFSAPYDPTLAAGGYIAAGDRVDVIVGSGGQASFALQNLRVLSVGTPAEVAAKSTPSVMVLDLSEQQALSLHQLLTGTSGPNTRFVLRSSADAGSATAC